MSTTKIVALGACTFVILAVIVLLFTFNSEKRMSYEACTKAGGVAVKAYVPGQRSGAESIACISSAAVIKP